MAVAGEGRGVSALRMLLTFAELACREEVEVVFPFFAPLLPVTLRLVAGALLLMGLFAFAMMLYFSRISGGFVVSLVREAPNRVEGSRIASVRDNLFILTTADVEMEAHGRKSMKIMRPGRGFGDLQLAHLHSFNGNYIFYILQNAFN